MRVGLSWVQAVGTDSDQGLARLGLSAQPWSGAQLGFAVSVRSGVGQELQVSVAQAVLQDLELRAGQRWSWPDEELGALAGLSVGMGIKAGSWRVDYAFLPRGDFGQVHQLSLELGFGQAHPEKKGALQAGPAEQPALKTGTAAEAPAPAAASAPAGAPFDPGLSLQILSSTLTQGLLLQREGRWNESVQVLRQAVQADARDMAAWRALANAYEHLGHTDFARHCYRQILRLDPGDRLAQEWLQLPASPSPAAP